MTAACGFLLIDKPEGPTTFAVLGPLRHTFRKQKVGHAGTLDSGASGLVIAAVGSASRLLNQIEAAEKEYTFRLHLGFATDTGDLTGAATERVSDCAEPDSATRSCARTVAELRSVLAQFLGEIDQVPPLYSALKIDGKRASDRTRAGQEVELAARRVTISELELMENSADQKASGDAGAGASAESPERVSTDLAGLGATFLPNQDAAAYADFFAREGIEPSRTPSVKPLGTAVSDGSAGTRTVVGVARGTLFHLRCVVSKGTYVRSLGRDIAQALGTIGCVSGIRRLRVGSLRVTDAWNWERRGDPPAPLPVESVLALPQLTAEPLELGLLRSGVRIARERLRWREPAKASNLPAAPVLQGVPELPGLDQGFLLFEGDRCCLYGEMTEGKDAFANSNSIGSESTSGGGSIQLVAAPRVVFSEVATDIPLRVKRTCLITGNFDGCHLGHRALFERVEQEARARHLRPLVVSFTPHTRCALSPHCHLNLLTSDQEKRELIEGLGLDLELLPFDEALRALPPEQFLTEVVRDQLGGKLWVMGYNHHFGAKAAGNYENMLAFASSHGIELLRLEAVEAGEQAVSSTRIRQLLEEGRVLEANELLGYAYRLSGTVVAGAGRGAGLGFATANLKFDHPCKQGLPDGVYAGRVLLNGLDAKDSGLECGKADVGRGSRGSDRGIPAVANMGSNPTFADQQRRLEIHLLDWQGDLYGQRISYAVEARLREERKFATVEELKAQVAADIEAARDLLEN
jgi:riboflavin kinase/FMN adenylyltransferase